VINNNQDTYTCNLNRETTRQNHPTKRKGLAEFFSSHFDLLELTHRKKLARKQISQVLKHLNLFASVEYFWLPYAFISARNTGQILGLVSITREIFL
jgi:hypothetical protein